MAIGKITSKSLDSNAVTSVNLAPGAVTISDIPDGEITVDKLHTTLDLSTKTLTLTQSSVTAHQSALSVTQSQISDLSTTTDLTEGTNLYFTNARADARAQIKVDAIVGSAPGTLDTLNELAAALGDDANFSTTVTNNIATKLPLAGGTMTGGLTGTSASFATITSTSSIQLGDSVKAQFGASNDLQIYHDGFHARVNVGTGNFNLQTDDFHLTDSSNNSIRFRVDADGPTRLYHNANQKLETTSTGINVTGTVTSDGLIIGGDGVVKGERGTASAPAYSFTDDADTGMFNISNANLGFSVSGTERMRIQSDGAVVIKPNGITTGLRLQGRSSDNNFYIQFKSNNGSTTHSAIGTESATNGLLYNSDIHRFNSTSSATEYMRITDVGNVHLNSGLDVRIQLGTSGSGATSVSENSVYVRGNDDHLTLGAAGNGNIYFKENADTHMTIKTGGNVGIGATNPGYKLSVDNGTSDGGIFKIHNEEVGLNVSVNGAVGDYTNSERMVVFNATRYDSGTAPKLRLGGQSGIEFAADANNVRMVITNGGNVGINVASPSERLEVDGGIKISNSNSRLYFGTEGGTSYRALEGNTSGSLLQVGEGYTDIALQGNVGIGTSSPSAPLHIKKSISSTYTGGNTGVTNSLFNITNTLSTSTVNAQANIQIGINDGTYNRVTGIAAVAESTTNRKTSLVFWTDDNNTRAEKLRITGDGALRVGDNSTSQAYGPTIGYMQTIQAPSGNQSYLSIARPGVSLDDNGLIIGEDTSNSYITQRNNKPVIITQNDNNAVLISSIDAGGTGSGGARMYVYGGIRTTTPGGLFTDMYNGGSGFYGTGGYFGGPIFRTPNLGASSSGEATQDIFNMYTSGHWGQGSYIRVCVFTRYYGSGYREYFLRQDRGSSTITIQQRHEGGGENAPYLDVHNATLVGSGTHSGQTVRRQTVRLRTGGPYHNCFATIEFAQVANAARVWDSASSTTNVDNNARTSGGGIHFLNFRVDNNNSEYNQRNQV